MLELEEVHKHYASPGGEVRAVDGVSLTVARGEAVVLLGPSGSGKTTLLLLAAGLLMADSGAVRFNDRDLRLLSKQEVLRYRRTSLGFIFQNFNLVPGMSAEENVALPLLLRGVDRREARARALAALEQVALDARAAHAPDRLSGGEQQRVAIARALVGEPSLVLADEPTGNLDTESGDEVLSILGDLQRRQGVAMLLVTHDLRVARRADRMLVMRDGRLTAAEGDPEEVISA